MRSSAGQSMVSSNLYYVGICGVLVSIYFNKTNTFNCNIVFGLVLYVAALVLGSQVIRAFSDLFSECSRYSYPNNEKFRFASDVEINVMRHLQRCCHL